MSQMAAEGDPEALKKEMGNLDTTTPEEKANVAVKKKTGEKKEDSPKKKRAAKEVDPNTVTLKDLSKEHGLTTAAARRKLRAAGLKADGRWSWQKDSPALKKASAALEAKEDDAE